MTGALGESGRRHFLTVILVGLIALVSLAPSACGESGEVVQESTTTTEVTLDFGPLLSTEDALTRVFAEQDTAIYKDIEAFYLGNWADKIESARGPSLFSESVYSYFNPNNLEEPRWFDRSTRLHRDILPSLLAPTIDWEAERRPAGIVRSAIDTEAEESLENLLYDWGYGPSSYQPLRVDIRAREDRLLGILTRARLELDRMDADLTQLQTYSDYRATKEDVAIVASWREVAGRIQAKITTLEGIVRDRMSWLEDNLDPECQGTVSE
ncbi:MAG: hypothetical protein ACYC5Q_07145 [Thermoleophilia bacterium]